MSNLIHEIPAWSINGVNWVFTTSVNYDTLIKLVVDWVELSSSNYTYVAPTITLSATYEPHYNITSRGVVWSGFAMSTGEIYLPNQWFIELPDWTRTIFTLSSWENIEEIIKVIADWAEVLPNDYSINPNNATQIILSFAPKHSSSPMNADVVVTASTGSDDNFADNSTQADIINRIYKIINEKTTSITYDLEETKKIICEIQRQICVWSYVDVAGNKYKAPKLSFLTRKRFYRTTEATDIAISISNIDTSITVSWDVADYKQSWYLRIEWDIVKYTNLNYTTKVFTWVTGIDSDHNSGTKVNQVYALPENFMEAFLVKVFDTQYHYYEPSPIPYKEIRSDIFATEYFSLEQDKEWNEYLMIRWFDNDYTIEFNYTRVPPCITASINSIIPDPYAIRILPRLVAADLLTMWDWINAWIVEMWRLQEQDWVKNLMSLYEEFATKVETYRQKIPVWKWYRKWSWKNYRINSYYN